MNIIETGIKDCIIIEPNVFKDERGYFLETFNSNTFKEKTGLDVQFVQDNESKSNTGVVRGLHCQLGEHAQAKLVSVTIGKVIDVAVDMRRDSATFMKHVAVELSGENKRRLFVPRGFLHGFVVLEDNTIFSYKCDNFYNKASDSGILWNDVDLNINWGVPMNNAIVSDKDRNLMTAKEFVEKNL
jgi:dTDP-4-dehydrorhamnose 3,5-epimerase